MPTRRVTYRLYPTQMQEQKLRWARKMHKELYNSALANRKTQYQKFRNKVDYYQQQNSLPSFKEVWTEYKLLNAGSLQATLKRVDFAYQRFFQGLGKYPRFKSIRHYWRLDISRWSARLQSAHYRCEWLLETCRFGY